MFVNIVIVLERKGKFNDNIHTREELARIRIEGRRPNNFKVVRRVMVMRA